MVQYGMTKDQAIALLGGSTRSAAQKMGVSYQAICRWPSPLPRRIEERVLGVVARDRMDLAALLADAAATPAAKEGAHV